MLSILIPTYNRACYQLAKILSQQCALVEELQWEIVIVDDGSTDAVAKASNKWCEDIEGVRLVMLEQNVGRAAVRNYAVKQAKGDWLIIMDDDVMPKDEGFVAKYVRIANKDYYDVLCGGVVALHTKEDETSLRWIYDAYAEEKMTLQWRRDHNYDSFTTQNFMARRSVFDKLQFDESLKQYGYEDALFGIGLQEKGVSLYHINNPVVHLGLEPNPLFMEKTEKALQNLHSLGVPMTERATVSVTAQRLKRKHLLWMVKLWHFLFGRLERRMLCSKYPSVHVFQLYKLGYYALLKKKKANSN